MNGGLRACGISWVCGGSPRLRCARGGKLAKHDDVDDDVDDCDGDDGDNDGNDDSDHEQGMIIMAGA